ncbi:MAG: ATP-binding cassette domain-containing protein [Eubacteriales bacterium]
MIEAAKIANVHDFIMSFAGWYIKRLLMKKEQNVSQGEKQLITIARAVLADPSILILDEATSSIDTRLEKKLQKAMQNIMVGRTSF